MNLIQMSFLGATLILAVVVIRAIAVNKLPKKTFLILWEIVLLRLLVPVSIPSPFSVYSVISRKGSPGYLRQNDALNALTETTLGGTPDTSALKPPSIWAIVWCVGMFLCAAYFITVYLRCRLKFRTSLPVRNDFVGQWLKAHPSKRRIAIRQSDQIRAPLTYGIVRPVILMPKKTDWSQTKRLQYILLHEYIHIRRCDAIFKFLATAALCIHWFNPLVWLMYVLLNRDIELACDESVVRRFGENTKTTYAMTLISMEEQKSGLMPLGNYFSKNAIEERIIAIMKQKKASVPAILTAAVLIVSVTAIFATSAKKEPEETIFVTDAEDTLANVQIQETAPVPAEETDVTVHNYSSPDDGTEKPAASAAMGTVNADALKVRTEADGGADVVGLLKNGETITILDESGDFYKVSVQTENGTLVGWVKKEYITF